MSVRTCIAAIALLLMPRAASAGSEGAGTAAASFLSVGPAVGMIGMGGAGLGLEGGLATASWNLATLAGVRRSEIVFTHAALADQTAQEWGGFAGRLPFGGLKGAVTGLFQSEGTFEGRDAFNNPTGSFDVSSMALGLGIARGFGRSVTAGLGFKYASENLGVVRGSGLTFDAGLQVRAGAFGFGAAAQNAFGKMRYDGAAYDFPSSYGVGVSYDHVASGVRVALDMNFPPAYYTDVRGGVEWRWNDRFALRTGYRAELGASGDEPLGGPTFGMGAGARGMWLDYGYLAGAGAGQHRVGITFQPAAMRLAAVEPDRGGAGYASSPGASPMPTSDAASRDAKRAGTPATVGASGAAGASATPGTSTSPGAAVTPVGGRDAAGTERATTLAKQPPATADAAARTPAKSTPETAPAAASAKPAPASAAPTSAKPAPASAPMPTSAVAGPGAGASAGAAAVAGQAAATGPVATNLSTARTAPPSYTQRAKAARGTSEASASGRATAAANAGTGVTTRAPVAPAADAAVKRDSAATAKTSAPATAASASPGTAAGAKPDPAATAQSPSASPPPATTAVSAPKKPRPEKIRVKNGQTMADIARAWDTSVPAIMMENNLVSDRVRPGQVLKLPRR